MRQVHTAQMGLYCDLKPGAFALEPYEAGWASEAMAVIYIREVHHAQARLVVRPQISADGARWIDYRADPLPITEAGGYYLTLTQFGNWLRLVGEVIGGREGEAAFVADFYWVLKE